MADLITAAVGLVGVLVGGYLTHWTQIRALRDTQANDRRTREADIVGELAATSVNWMSTVGNKILDAENHARGLGNLETTARAMERWEVDSRAFASALARVRCGTLNPELRAPLRRMWAIWHEATHLVNRAYLTADDIRSGQASPESWDGARYFEEIQEFRKHLVAANDGLSDAARAWDGHLESKRPWWKRILRRGEGATSTPSVQAANPIEGEPSNTEQSRPDLSGAAP